MGFDIKGKTALVTGANRGIGKSIAETLLDGGVSRLYAAVRDPKSAQPLVDKYGDKVMPIELDLSKPATIAQAASTATDVELLVNNGGILRNAFPLDDDAEEKMKEQMDVNVYGLMRICKAFAPILKANGGGAIVQLNSVASTRCFAPFATYAASKAASYSVTQGIRDQLAEQNTQVLSVHPGPIDTDMATQAGFDQSDPPKIVAESIVNALAAGEFHTFPDSFAREIWKSFEGFARNVIEAG